MRLAIIFTMMPTGRAFTSLNTRAARARARGSKNARRVKPSKTGAAMLAECRATGPRTTARGRLRRSRGSRDVPGTSGSNERGAGARNGPRSGRAVADLGFGPDADRHRAEKE